MSTPTVSVGSDDRPLASDVMARHMPLLAKAASVAMDWPEPLLSFEEIPRGMSRPEASGASCTEWLVVLSRVSGSGRAPQDKWLLL